MVGIGQAGDPLGRGREQDPVPGLAGPDRQPGGEVGLAGAWRAEEHDVVLGGDEVQGAQVGDHVAFEAAGVVEVELLEGLAGREPGRADPALTAVGLPGGDLALQAGDEELLVGPGLGPGPLGQPGHGLPQRRRLQRPGQERDLRWSGPGWWSWRGRPSGHPTIGAQGGVVHGQVPLLDFGLRGRSHELEPFATQGPCRGEVGRVGDRLVLGPDPFVVGDQAPSQVTRTRCRSATSIRRPITAGCTE